MKEPPGKEEGWKRTTRKFNRLENQTASRIPRQMKPFSQRERQDRGWKQAGSRKTWPILPKGR